MHLEGVFVCFRRNWFQYVCPMKMENTELMYRLKKKNLCRKLEIFVRGRNICPPWYFIFHTSIKLLKIHFIVTGTNYSAYRICPFTLHFILWLFYKWGFVVPMGYE